MGGFLGARRRCAPAGRPAGRRRAAGLWALFHAQTLLADSTGRQTRSRWPRTTATG